MLPSIWTVPAADLAIVVSEAWPNSMAVVTCKLPDTVVVDAVPLAIVTSTSPSAFVSPSYCKPSVKTPS